MALDRATWAGLDPDGFASLDRLLAFARRGEADFVRLYPSPALFVEATTAMAARAATATADRERSFARTQTAEDADVGAADPGQVARYVGRVGFLTKRPGNLFPEMVTVGRALNNDLALVVNSVSKVHGYFREEPGLWSFTDQRSTNGTFHGGRRLEPGERVVLADGDRLQFGPDIEVTFHLPASLARRLVAAAAPS